jgi:membrane associated rhomboid family serine protease
MYTNGENNTQEDEKKEMKRNKSHVQFFKKSYSIEDYMTEQPNTSIIDMKHVEISNQEDEERITKKKKKRFRWLTNVYKKQHIGPFATIQDEHCSIFTYIFMSLIIVMFSGEILQSQLSTGEFFELNPFNFMLGPSIEIMIQTGARFTPCMRDTDDMPPGENFVCLNTLLKSDLDLLDIITEPELDNVSCTLQSLCGMTGFHQQDRPDQTFRFITPLVVHTGIFHLAVNCWYLYMLGTRIEKIIGPLLYSSRFPFITISITISITIKIKKKGESKVNNHSIVLFLGTGIFGHVFGSLFAHTTTRELSK